MAPTQGHPTRCPWCREAMAGAVCMGCGFNRRARRFERTIEERDEAEPRPGWRQRWRREGMEAFREREVPLGMIAASVLAVISFDAITGHWADLPLAVPALLTVVAFDTAWMYAGIATLETLIGGSYGPWREVTLKLAGINCCWYALWLPLVGVHPILGSLVMFAITPLLIFFLLRWLFEMDLFWTGATLVMIWTVRFVVSLILPG